MRPTPCAGYFAEEDGRIYSEKSGRHLKSNIRRNGGKSYCRETVRLFVNGASRTYTVARLVCWAFHGPAPSLRHEAAHLDGDTLNNHKDNLAWKTHSENIQDKKLHGTHGYKLTEDAARDILENYQPHKNAGRLARKHGVSPNTVWSVFNGRLWPHLQKETA